MKLQVPNFFKILFAQDYVTEKYYNILPYNVIPVVYNGADMSRLAPPHSFIDVGEFKSVEKLADYLNLLDRNDALFASYFWWRDYYRLEVRVFQSD